MGASKGKNILGALDAIAVTDRMKAAAEVIVNNEVQKMLVTTLPPLEEFQKHGIVIKPGEPVRSPPPK